MSQQTPTPTTRDPLPGPLVAGLDLLTVREQDADGLAHALAAVFVARGATAVTVATHWARAGELRHVALSVATDVFDPDPDPDPNTDSHADVVWALLSDALRARVDDSVGLVLGGRYAGASRLRDAVEHAVFAHRTRSSGRVVVFPGSAQLTGMVRVAQILASSAIGRVRVLAAGDAAPDTLLETRDFLRPRWVDGELVLDTQPAAGGTLVPFETPFPTPCCAQHS